MYCSFRLVFRGTREGAPALLFLPPAQVKNGYAWLTLSRAHNQYISCRFRCPASGWLWVTFLRMYGVLTLHLLHMQSMHSCRLHGQAETEPILLLQPTGPLPEVSSVAGLLVRHLQRSSTLPGADQSCTLCAAGFGLLARRQE